MSQTERPLATPDTDLHEDRRTWIATLRLIQEQVAASVIAGGVMQEGTEWLQHVVELLGDDKILANIEALDERLVSEGYDTRVTCPAPHNPNYRQHLGDAALSVGVAWGHAGYLVGLAVGMKLGPHAFEGGAR